MKVVIDTNVFISGVFWKGPPYKILEAWAAGKFKLVISAPILEEYSRVLSELGSRYPTVKYNRILELVELQSEMISAVAFAKPVCRDPDDDKFISAALSGGAEFLVSGDKDLLDLDGFHGIAIVKPGIFLKRV